MTSDIVPPRIATQSTLNRGVVTGKRIDGRSWSLDYDTAVLSPDGSQTTIPLKALFTDIKLDRKSYSVVLVTADGAELSFSLRELFQQFHEETRGG